MISNSWRGFDFALGEDVDALRETVARFANDQIAPRADEIDRTNTFPGRPVAEARRTRRARRHGRGGIRRRRARLSGALRRHGGDFARLGLGRPFLRGAFQSLRQPDPPQRHGRAAAALSAEARLRRACRRARDVGTEFRLRRGFHAHPRRQEGRPLRPQRLEDVDHQRSGGADLRGLRQDRSGRGLARHHGLHRRERLSRVSARRRNSTSSACAAPTRASSYSRIARCRRRTCSGGRARASTC